MLEIENLCFGETAWTEAEFLRCLRQRNCIAMVAEHETQKSILGYSLYELHKNRLHLLNLAVDPFWCRTGIGTKLLDFLKRKLTPGRRERILLETREGNLTAQMFFRSQGFKAVSVLRDFYEDCDEDAYVFQYRLPAEVHANQEANR